MKRGAGSRREMALLHEAVLALIKAVVFVYDILSYPVYCLVYKPWRSLDRFNRIRARKVSVAPGEVTYRGVDRHSQIRDEIISHSTKINTMDKMMNFLFEKYSGRRCLGTRKVLGEKEERLDDGRTVTKLKLGSYSWLNYWEVAQRSEQFGRGLRLMGLQQRDKVVVYADTRAEWMMAAAGCFKYNFSIVTIYTNLGESGVQYGILQTEAPYVLVSQSLLPKLFNVLKNLHCVSTIIVMEETHKGPLPEPPKGVSVSVKTFDQVLELGKTQKVQPTPPLPEDTAIVMYTSGSSGDPKGVMLSHENLVQALCSIVEVVERAVGSFAAEGVYIAYLPLAHVLELLAENAVLLLGQSIGYSSPYTLIDSSPLVLRGQPGDASLLKPTLMAAVPVILDRIYKGINQKIADSGPFRTRLVQYFIAYRSQWISRGFDTPIANLLIFKKMRQVVGGQMKALLCGGAPLSEEVHQFIRACLCVSVHQGYGLTETCASACVMDEHDISTGAVGAPLPGVDIKLVDWEEGNYRVTDKGGARGEIIVGGLNVAKGYYNMPDKTNEEFFNENGKRWFRTGDIGHVRPNGTINIIDRKKDLVKLQMGEYVSLGKVEAVMKYHPLVESICVCARPTEKVTVALVVPDQAYLANVGRKLQRPENVSRSSLCGDVQVVSEVLKSLQAHGAAVKLERFEVPQAIQLVDQPWTPDSGFVTAAMKLKRKVIEEAFKKDIDQLYAFSCASYSEAAKARVSKKSCRAPVV